jgi:hypothetical protein
MVVNMKLNIFCYTKTYSLVVIYEIFEAYVGSVCRR